MSVKIYSVTQITKLIKDILEANFYGIWVEGEISSLRYSSTGHLYFSLVDEKASLGVIVYKNRLKNIRFELKNGMKVVLFGSLSLYLKGGEYRIVAEHIRLSGAGKKFYDLEKLKQEFKQQGYFDRKRAVPPYPRKVIVITSPTGAAVQDIINIIKRRGAGVDIYIYPVSVQGETAKESILKAFKEINKIDKADMVVLARGGGSNEDLWIFNDPDIAKGFFDVKFPTISAVGHETDFTLCDFVADLRAETPSAAAELITKSRVEMLENIKKFKRILGLNMQRILNNNNRQLTLYSKVRFRLRIDGFIGNRILYLDNLEQRIDSSVLNNIASKKSQIQKHLNVIVGNSPSTKLKTIKHKTELFQYKIEEKIKLILEYGRRDLDGYTYKLTSLNPENILKRGYTITTDTQGKPLKSVNEAKKNDCIITRFFDGSIKSTIKN